VGLRSLAGNRPFAKLIRGSGFASVVVMSERSPKQIDEQIRELLDRLYRVDSGRMLATLIRLLGDFDLAEEAMHEAFAAALSLWPTSGVPDNPRPWLISTARFKAIDTLRRRARFDASQDEQRASAKPTPLPPTLNEEHGFAARCEARLCRAVSVFLWFRGLCPSLGFAPKY
jgi:DNA-directed RNA polymerase specialized sigma24 family protein